MFAPAALALLLASSVVGQNTTVSDPRTCGTTISDERFAEVEKNFTAVSAMRVDAALDTTIQVYFHVIAESTSASGGYLSYVFAPLH